MLAYISLNINDESKKELHNLVKQYLSEDDFCFLARKGGDVSFKAHLTLFFGLIYEKLDKERISNILQDIKNNIKFVDVYFIRTWHFNSCNLVLAQVQNTRILQKYHNIFLRFPHDKRRYKGFKPHVSMAYVNKNIDLNFNRHLRLNIEEVELKIFGPFKK